MASGLLTGTMTRERIQNMPRDDWRKSSPDFQEPRLSRNLRLAELLTEIAYPHNVTAGVVAVAWALRNPAVSGAIVGTRNRRQIEDMVAAAEFRLNDVELRQIDDFLQQNP
jgi:aryl-alcohol dehydrogenase-like predicted oxidoreductase